jgi:PPK2 family polyphosphate:nucleotide phosphotransferase
LNYIKKFIVKPGSRVRLSHLDPGFTDPKVTKKRGLAETQKHRERMDSLQQQLYAEQKRSLLICLQGPDAAGKDGVIRHVISGLNPQGCRVVSFKEPTHVELEHDFLWRIESQVPKHGEIVVFNRSHYEDVLIVRVHDLVPKSVWSKRYHQINEFEQRLADEGTHILKFFLHISKEEQLRRFRKRLDDPNRQWKISEADYTERKYWKSYVGAFEEAFDRCSVAGSPWYVIPSDSKWFRDLAVSSIIADTLEGLRIRRPEPTVDLAEIRRKYHETAKRG